MLNFDVKEEALDRLKKANNEYQEQAEVAKRQAVSLYELRKKSSKRVIEAVERYVNSLANSPKEFDRAVSEFRLAIERFDEVVQEVQTEAERATVQSGVMAGTAVGTGAAVAAFGPTAAMAVATTFGTASTGTAISALSGAAATNAALAWLGGGALVAGGGGVAAGNALLALAGPVGWGIGAVALAGTAVWTNGKNAEVAEEANKEAGRIQGQTRALEAACREIERLKRLTNEHTDGAMTQLGWLRRYAPAHYSEFGREAKEELAALINNIRALSKLLNQQVA